MVHESVSLSTTFTMGIRSGGFQAGSTEFFLGGIPPKFEN